MVRITLPQAYGRVLPESLVLLTFSVVQSDSKLLNHCEGGYPMTASKLQKAYGSVRGILRRMRNILNQYRFVKIANESEHFIGETLEYGKTPFNRAGKRLKYVTATAYIKDEFKKKYSKVTFDEIDNICEDTIANEYLEPRTINGKDGGIEQVAVTKLGRDLLDRAGFIPIGLFYAWWSKYGVFLAGIGVGAIIALLIALLKLIIKTIIGK